MKRTKKKKATPSKKKSAPKKRAAPKAKSKSKPSKTTASAKAKRAAIVKAAASSGEGPRTYGEVSSSLSARHGALFIPSLAALLMRAEQISGRPLSEAQIVKVRDGALCMVVRRSEVSSLDATRGYSDVDPADVVESWRRISNMSGG